MKRNLTPNKQIPKFQNFLLKQNLQIECPADIHMR
jgi:hypothetical protein